jgi:hypothetical protein
LRDSHPLLTIRSLFRELMISLDLQDRFEESSLIYWQATRSCVTCNAVTQVLENVPYIDFSTIPGNMVTMDLQTLMDQYVNEQEVARCASCRQPSRLRTVTRTILGFPRFVPINFQRYYEWSDYMLTSIRVPLRLNIAGQTFRLVAIIHRESMYGDYFANFVHNDQWFEYKNNQIVPIEMIDNALSSTASSFLYYPTA